MAKTGSQASDQADKPNANPRARTGNTSNQRRDRYLRHLYLLLTLIAVLLLVMIVLIPDHRDSSRQPVVGEAEPREEVPGEEVPGEAEPGEEVPGEAEPGEEVPGEAEPGEAEPGEDVPATSDDSDDREPPRDNEGDDRADGAGDEQADNAEDDQAPPEQTTRQDANGSQEPADDSTDASDGDPDDRQDGSGTTGEDQQTAPEPGSRGHIYFVLDDAGYSAEELRPFLRTGVPMTVSVLPHLEYSREAARLVEEAGQDVILHLPMEPLIDIDPGPGAIYTDNRDREIRTRIGEALDSVPTAIGANNHMGSAVTGNREAMQTIMDEFYRRDLFFLDSVTSPASAVPAVAAEMAVPYLRRHVFVDHERDEASMADALERGIELAQEDGAAVLIGHVQTGALSELLEEAYERALERGVSFEGLSHLRDTAYLVDTRQ